MAKNIERKNLAKRIVYLFGAGATQAELEKKGSVDGVLMRDIKDEMLRRIHKGANKKLAVIKNELVSDDVNIEHLISLYESTGIPKHKAVVDGLKKLFKDILQERTKGVKSTLFSALIDMHNINQLKERIVGILTLNYEDILDRAIQEVENSVNYSVDMDFKHELLKEKMGCPPFPILKLHGSFNWKNEFPIIVFDNDKIKRTDFAVWIPPGVEKRKEKYPFNIIWGRAREILNCDILRIIGCSLDRNDWELVSLLYTTQKLNSRKNYTIELIDFINEGIKIRKNYGYLQFRLIDEIKEVRNYLTNNYFLDTSKEELLTEAIKRLTEKGNIFDLWLRAKGADLKDKNIQINTATNIFSNYVNEVTNADKS